MSQNKKPRRVQRKRIWGWKMPPNTVYVGRPTKWGNPFRMRKLRNGGTDYLPLEIIELYRMWLMSGWGHHQDWLQQWRASTHIPNSPIADFPELRGKNLACWCPLDQPCHADVLLEIANA